MNFDTFFSMNAMGANAGMLAGPVQTGAGMFGAAPSSEFSDLLGLVTDLQLADEQEGVMDEVLSSELSQMVEGNNLSLQAQAWNATPFSTSSDYLAGTTEEISALTGEVSASQPLQAWKSSEFPNQGLQLSSLEVEGAKLLSEQKGNMPAAAQKSLEAWSVPLLAGDLKAVQLEKKKATPLLQKLNFQQAKPEISQDLLGSSLVKGSVASFATPKLVEALPGNLPSSKSVQKFNVGDKAKNFSEASLAFLGGDATLTTKFEKTESFVQMPEQLMSTQDTRVSSSAINFVSSQVELLKAKGGGEMIVNLQPVELGEIQIQVTREGSGDMKVVLTAAKEATAKLFENSKESLSAALEGHGAKLELQKFEALKSVNAPLARAEQASNSTNSTESFLQNMRSDIRANENVAHKQQVTSFDRATQEQTKVVVGAENSRASTGSGHDFGSNLPSDREGFQRQKNQDSEEQRQAYKKWQESLEERKLA